MKLLSHRLFVFPFTLLALCLWTQSLSAQDPIQAPEGIPPESNYMYSQHLEQVEQIMKGSDLGARTTALESFMTKLHPESKILQYFESFFSQTVGAYSKAGNTAQAQALSDKMRKLFPDSPMTQAHLVNEAYSSKNYAKAIQLGEKVNATSPNQQTTMILAQSYMATNDEAKAAKYSLKALEGIDAKQGAVFVVWLAQYHGRQRDIANSAKYYDMLLKAFPGSGPAGWDSTQWNNLRTDAYTMRATGAYVAKSYDAAIKGYHEALRQNPKSDSAYLYLGLSHWKLQQLEEAMDAFAKATVIGQTQAAKARGYLEQIYKPRNNNSLEGLDALLEKARAALQ